MFLDRISAAVFDMDGTLIDSLIVWDVIWEELGVKYLSKCGFRPSAEDDKAVRTMTLDRAMAFINGRYGLDPDDGAVLETVNGIIARFYSEEVEVKDGVIEFLDHLALRGVKMCVASATDKALLMLAMEHCGLGKYFDTVLSCADIGKGKDRPDIYVAAMERLGGSLSDTCVFEDSLVAVRTAHELGLMTVGIYDKCNYGHEEMVGIVDRYVGDGESLLKLTLE